MTRNECVAVKITKVNVCVMFIFLRFKKKYSKLMSWNLGDLYTESGQTLKDSFLAVSKPLFATKYSLERKALADIYTMHWVLQISNLKVPKYS